MKLIRNKEYYLWGTGNHARYLMETFGYLLDGLNIKGWIDNNKEIEGKYFFGKKIFLPDVLKNNSQVGIVICTIYREDVIEQIKQEYPDVYGNVEDESIFEKLNLLYRYKDSTDQEIVEICDYLQSHRLSVFNYLFKDTYSKDIYSIEYDEDEGLFFTRFGKKEEKLFFSRKFKTIDEVKDYYCSINIEQDPRSPHRYLSEMFEINDDSVVIDAGVAEGNFALSIINKVRKIYLFEPDNDWVYALERTFKDYKDKVVIVNKFLSNYSDEKTTTIDNEIKEKVDYIKMDIEGEELYALQGAVRTIENPDIQILVATYHQEFAYDVIDKFLKDNGFMTKTTSGYMWYPSSTNIYRAPVLRRGILRAKRGERK